MAERIKGRLFRNLHEDYQAFFDYGPGAMCWATEEGHRVLWFLALPPADNPRGVRFEVARIYPAGHAENNWAAPGPRNGWDGNVERPTLHPSIWLNDRRGWHGWIKGGDLETA